MHYSSVLDPLLPNAKPRDPIRILHVIGSLGMGGVETWLMQILRSIDRDRFQMDFLVGTPDPAVYDHEARSLGSQILPCLGISRPWVYATNFRHLLADQPSYDIIHSHVHYFNGWILWLAGQSRIPMRIAHSHNDHRQIEQHRNWRRQAYRTCMKTLLQHYATHSLSTSQQAAIDLWGETWKPTPHHQILYSGIDLALFENGVDGTALRTQLGIPFHAQVIGHAGRFETQKNHAFLLEIVAAAIQQNPNLYLLLLGEGTHRQEMEQKARALGIADQVIFTGIRLDKAALMLGAMDIFLFPSLHEGLGMAVVEAQAAGLPCLISDVIPEEATVVPSLVRSLSLSDSAQAWADALLKMLSQPPLSQAEALAQVQESPLNNTHSLKKLTQLYESVCSVPGGVAS